MKILDRLGCISLAAAFLWVVGQAAEPNLPFPATTQVALDRALDEVMKQIEAPGLIAGIWVPGRGSYVATRGVADAVTGQPMTGTEYFRIGSITKTVTVTALLLLADDQKLSLDDPVGRYLPFVPNGQNITLRMLANMTSGLFSYTADEAWVTNLLVHPELPRTPRELVDVGFQHAPTAAPGAKWDYVNSNTVLLGMVIERITGRPVQDFFAERIFRPLGMINTIWPTNTALPTPYAHGVTRQTLDGSKTDATHWNPSWAYSAGQLISNLSDLKIWVKAYATGQLLSREMQRQRLQWGTLPPNTAVRKYGLGIGFEHGWLGHTGELPGYNAAAYYLPDQDATLVVLVNSDIPTGKLNPAPAVVQAITRVVTPGNQPE